MDFYGPKEASRLEAITTIFFMFVQAYSLACELDTTVRPVAFAPVLRLWVAPCLDGRRSFLRSGSLQRPDATERCGAQNWSEPLSNSGWTRLENHGDPLFAFFAARTRMTACQSTIYN